MKLTEAQQNLVVSTVNRTPDEMDLRSRSQAWSSLMFAYGIDYMRKNKGDFPAPAAHALTLEAMQFLRSERTAEELQAAAETNAQARHKQSLFWIILFGLAGVLVTILADLFFR